LGFCQAKVIEVSAKPRIWTNQIRQVLDRKWGFSSQDFSKNGRNSPAKHWKFRLQAQPANWCVSHCWSQPQHGCIRRHEAGGSGVIKGCYESQQNESRMLSFCFHVFPLFPLSLICKQLIWHACTNVIFIHVCLVLPP